jgi:hypothetical protein
LRVALNPFVGQKSPFFNRPLYSRPLPPPLLGAMFHRLREQQKRRRL